MKRGEALMALSILSQGPTPQEESMLSTGIAEDPQDAYGRDAGMREPKSLLSRSPQFSADVDMCKLSHKAEKKKKS